MIPEWRQRQIREMKTKKLERSKGRYIGIGCTMVGFALLLITIITGGKLQKEYGLFVLFAPILSAMVFGFVVGSFSFVVQATKLFIEFVVDMYLGYDYDELIKKLQ